eukprot:COSAG01_NODE_48634_length_379_cov_0.942857_1_plen_43_part_01
MTHVCQCRATPPSPRPPSSGDSSSAPSRASPVNKHARMAAAHD